MIYNTFPVTKEKKHLNIRSAPPPREHIRRSRLSLKIDEKARSQFARFCFCSALVRGFYLLSNYPPPAGFYLPFSPFSQYVGCVVSAMARSHFTLAAWRETGPSPRGDPMGARPQKTKNEEAFSVQV